MDVVETFKKRLKKQKDRIIPTDLEKVKESEIRLSGCSRYLLRG